MNGPDNGQVAPQPQHANHNSQLIDPSKPDTYVPDILAIKNSSYDEVRPVINPSPSDYHHSSSAAAAAGPMFVPKTNFNNSGRQNTSSSNAAYNDWQSTTNSTPSQLGIFSGSSLLSSRPTAYPLPIRQTARRSNPPPVAYPTVSSTSNARDYVVYPIRQPRQSRQPAPPAHTTSTTMGMQQQQQQHVSQRPIIINNVPPQQRRRLFEQEQTNLQSILTGNDWQDTVQSHNLDLLRRLQRSFAGNQTTHNHSIPVSVPPYQNYLDNLVTGSNNHQQHQHATTVQQQQQQQQNDDDITSLMLDPDNGSYNTTRIQNYLTSNYNPNFADILNIIRPQQPKEPPRMDAWRQQQLTEEDIARQDKIVEAEDDEIQQAETYADYMPIKLKLPGLQPHPDPVVETSSLATVIPPDISYKLKLPQEVIDKGLLSALQLEAVVYASQQHERILPDGISRGGYLIGDGAGVGKGRTIAGIIYENYLQGRKKSIWISVSSDLKLDAERDLSDIGADIPVYSPSKFPYGTKFHDKGFVLFLTYSCLISKSTSTRGSLGTRLGQITNWAGDKFDGVIVFDECHKAKNINPSGKGVKPSKTALHSQLIQEKLPNARVVYASATGASEINNMGYMTRLGIWGRGTPYGTFADFCKSVERRGVGAMELVAIDLKMRGAYIARQLSFKGTSFRIAKVKLSDEYKRIYDESVDLWVDAKEKFENALMLVNQDTKLCRSVWIQFWSSHQKYFKYLCIGAKVPFIIETTKQALDEGKCVIIGLQTTGEARTLEALEECNGDLTDFISTARAVFESLIENHFPAPPKSKESSSRSTPLSDEITIDQSWHSHEDITFLVNGGLTTATPCGTEPELKSKLNELVVNKKFAISDRSFRHQRRAKRNSRIAQGVQPDSESSSVYSADEAEDSMDDYRGSSAEESESSESSFTEEDSEEELIGKRKKRGRKSKTSKMKKKGNKSKKQSKINISPQKKRLIVSSSEESDDTITDADGDELVKRRVIDYVDLCDEEDDETTSVESSDPFNEHGVVLSEMRDELIKKMESLGPNLPNNTLDDLINQLGGPSKVSEMTGRKGRVVADSEGRISYESRKEARREARKEARKEGLEDAGGCVEPLNVEEKNKFMNDEKQVAIISEAASSGISLQADRRVKNQRRRVHITIELPWSADKAIQQFGRSHRSNQSSAPEYIFLISDLAGEQRFASIVTKRLESLGALTHGDRRATTESRDLSQFNILNRYGHEALEIILKTIVGDSNNRYAQLPKYIEGEDFLKDAKKALVGCGLATSGKNFYSQVSLEKDSSNMHKFLNRLLGMKVEIQNAVFEYFIETMESLIAKAKRLGNFDSGIMELSSGVGKVHCGEPDSYMLSCNSGLVRCELLSVLVERGLSWLEIMQIYTDNKKYPEEGFYTVTNDVVKSTYVMLAILEPTSSRTAKRYRIYKPNSGLSTKVESMEDIKDRGKKKEPDEVEELWTSIYDKTDKQCTHLCFFNKCTRVTAGMKCEIGLRHRKYCILSGGILTAWPYLERNSPEVTSKLNIVRLKTSDGRRVIGPIIPLNLVESVKKLLKDGQEKGVNF